MAAFCRVKDPVPARLKVFAVSAALWVTLPLEVSEISVAVSA